MHHTTITIQGNRLTNLSDQITQEFSPSFSYVSTTKTTYFYVFEQYSFLQNSDMSVILLFDLTTTSSCTAQVLIAGGKVGLLRWDLFGREKSTLTQVLQKLQILCEKNNWRMYESQKEYLK
jgi:hypothetical protein